MRCLRFALSDARDRGFPIRNNVYMLVGDGGNIVVQTGEQVTYALWAALDDIVEL